MLIFFYTYIIIIIITYLWEVFKMILIEKKNTKSFAIFKKTKRVMLIYLR